MKRKTVKRKLIILATIILTLLMSIFFISCGRDEVKAVKWDTEIENGADYETVEYGAEYILPEIYGLSKDGKRVNANISATAPSGKAVDASFGIISVNEVGKWKVVCSCSGVTDFVYNVICEDTVKPVIEVVNSPSDIEMGQDYPIVDFSYKDLAGIDFNSITYGLYYRQGEQETEIAYDSFSGYFTVENYGWYIFKTTAKDNNGNQSGCIKELFVKNHQWVDDNLPENYISTYNSEDYINTVTKTNILYWDSINNETWLSTFHGEEGVVKITMTYNSVLSGQATAKIRFPISEFTRENIDGIKIVYRIEQEIDSANLNFFHFDKENDTNFGSAIIKTSKVEESVNDGYWQELVFDNNQLAKMENEEGIIEGLQIGLSRGSENPSLTADVYLAKIIICKKLQTPQNLKIEDGKITWEPVENATAYRVEDINGNFVIVSENSVSAKEHSGRVNVVALSNDIFYMESDAASTINVDVQDGYLAAFDSSDYEGVASLSPIGIPGNAIISQEYLPEYLGEESVLKLSVYAAPNYAATLNQFATIVLKLPKGYLEDGYTIKMCAENVSDGTFGLAKDENWNNYYYTFNALADNEWKTVYVDTESADDVIYITWIIDNAGLEGRIINIYLSFVQDGDEREMGIYEGEGDGSIYDPESPLSKN